MTVGFAGLIDTVDALGGVQYKNVADDGFPTADMRWTDEIGSKGSSVVPDSLESNVVWLHELLFGEADYDPSKEVKEYSEQIISETSKYKNSKAL